MPVLAGIVVLLVFGGGGAAVAYKLLGGKSALPEKGCPTRSPRSYG
jgi:hypothetical protein